VDARNGVGVCYSGSIFKRGRTKVKIAFIALSVAALIAAPVIYARDTSSKTPRVHHNVFKKHPQVVSGYAPWRVNGVMTGYPGTFGYASGAPKDYTYENSRNGGGGGGGGM
jgi:hypothetical protein